MMSRGTWFAVSLGLTVLIFGLAFAWSVGKFFVAFLACLVLFLLWRRNG